MPRLYVGTSGFSYDTWAGGFYPEKLPASRRLSHYAQHLNAVELNGTFYRMPQPGLLQKWAAETKTDFRFSLKVQRGVTYSAPAFDKVGAARRFDDVSRALGERRGPLLLQFSPARTRDIALLVELLDAFSARVAVEFRDASWFDDEVTRCVVDYGAAIVVTDDENWPRATAAAAARFAYYRLRREYTDADLEEWSARIAQEASGVEEVHVYFRHQPQAPARALRLRQLLGDAWR